MAKRGKPANVKIPCSNCGGEPRNHEVLREFVETWEDDENGERGECTFQICRCKGCDLVRFREGSWSTYDQDLETGECPTTIKIYPEAVQSEHHSIETMDLPDSVSRIYSETIVAFNAGALTLAGGGLRAIVEAICIDRKVSGNNLQAKIDDLVAKCLLAKPQADLLHEERYIGNAALHEILPPARQEIEDGLAIVEGLMTTIYVLPLRAARLRKKRENRKSS